MSKPHPERSAAEATYYDDLPPGSVEAADAELPQTRAGAHARRLALRSGRLTTAALHAEREARAAQLTGVGGTAEPVTVDEPSPATPPEVADPADELLEG